MRRVGNVDDKKSARRCQVKTMSGGGDKGSASQNAVGIKTNGLALFQEIIVGISIDQSGDIADDKSLFAVGDVNESVKQIDRLLFVCGNVLPRGIERERARQRKAGRVFRLNPCALSKR